MESNPARETLCQSCGGTGDVPTDFGPTDCPDCGGTGDLAERRALVEWRIRDIERAVTSGIHPVSADIRWLIAQLRTCRKTLAEVVALAHDAEDPDGIAVKIRMVANRALDT